MIGTIALTSVLTTLVILLALNFRPSEKKLERKVEHRYTVADEQFRREMSVMLGPAIASGNRIEPLNNGEEIFPAMLAAIGAARETINFETFIYWSGSIGADFTAALSERARAGVVVKLLIDWVGSMKLDAAMIEQMEEAGVEVQRFRRPRLLEFGKMNNRTHRKLLIVDGRVGFTGGVGIADQWTGHAGNPDHWRDVHFVIHGPVVAQLQAAFNDNWIKTTGHLLHGGQYFPPLEPAGDLDAQMFMASPAGGSESMHLMFLTVIGAAASSIDLQAAYFVPDELIINALVHARERGVRVRILLPGRHIDAHMVRIASKAQWGPLLRAGVEIHVYQPTMIHNKLLIIDLQMISTGSTNMDRRSFSLNAEANLNIYDADFARRMTEVFERDLTQAKRYTYEEWRARPLKEKLLESLLRPIQSQL